MEGASSNLASQATTSAGPASEKAAADVVVVDKKKDEGARKGSKVRDEDKDEEVDNSNGNGFMIEVKVDDLNDGGEDGFDIDSEEGDMMAGMEQLSPVSDDDDDDDDDDSCEIVNEKDIEEMINTLNEPVAKYDWTTLAIRAGITTVIYPSQMAQILMQVGYEPYPPKRSVTLLGRPCLLLPSTGSYLRYIYQVDGWGGIFHGLTPRITQQLIFTYIFDRSRCYFRRRHVRSVFAQAQALSNNQAAITEDENNDANNEESEQSEFISAGFIDHFRDVAHELGSKLIAIVASYPVHVVVIRTIAQFVGREHCIRRSIFGEVQAIYQDFGILGFYRGLVPKLIGEACQGLAVGALTYFVSNQAPTIELRSLLNLSFSVLVSAWTYQFSVVSTTMAVNGSCLKAGRPPFQPFFNDWFQCWKELKDLNVLNRGSSFICRYYTGPTLMVNGMKEPTGIAFGPNHLSYIGLKR